MQLRPYQHNTIQEVRSHFIRGRKRVVMVMPTGSGKTVCFSYLAQNASQKGKRITIAAHREELLDQISRTLVKFDVPHSYIAADREYDPRCLVQVASVQTLARRLNKYVHPDFLIIDECHHAIPTTQWGKVALEYKDSFLLGVTATPCRLSGEGLGDLFGEMVIGPTTQALIASKDLCDYRPFVPSTMDTSGMHTRGGDYVRDESEARMDKPSITGDAVKHYRNLSHQKPAVVFCVSVAHAEHVARQFREAGYSAMSVDGGMNKPERKRIVRNFANGELNILTSCDLVSEGFDVPGIHTAILLRPTQSLSLYLQQVGRALRNAPGKDHAIILDHCGNIGRHGLPDDEREWTLESVDRSTRNKQQNEVSVRVCKVCFAAMRIGIVKCPSCGTEPEVKERKIEQKDGTLIELDKERARKELRKQQGSAKTIEELVAFGKSRGYKNPYGWASHVMKARAGRKK